jgi:hypothetical protein
MVIQVNLPVFRRSPETLPKNIIKSPASPIDANPNLVSLWAAGEFQTPKLNPWSLWKISRFKTPHCTSSGITDGSVIGF